MRSEFWLRFALLLITWASVSCRSLPGRTEEGYGLQVVSLRTRAEDTGQLLQQIQSKRPVDAAIHVPGALRVNCQISFAGRSSLDSYRKSYELDLCEARYRGRSHYRLSAQAIDDSMLRSLLAYPIFAALGFPVPAAEPVSAYHNDEYLGLYLFLETVDQEFFDVRDFKTGAIYKARFGNAGFKSQYLGHLAEAFTYEGKPDDFVLLQHLYEAVLGSADDATFYAQVQQYLDVDSFLRYSAAALYTCHWDGMNNNYYLVQDPKLKKLVVVPWDLDRIWERTDMLEPALFQDLNEILRRLMQIPVARQRFSELLGQLEQEFPVTRLQAELRHWGQVTTLAYQKDPVLSLKPQAAVLGTLEARIIEWQAKVVSFRETLR